MPLETDLTFARAPIVDSGGKAASPNRMLAATLVIIDVDNADAHLTEAILHPILIKACRLATRFPLRSSDSHSKPAHLSQFIVRSNFFCCRLIRRFLQPI